MNNKKNKSNLGSEQAKSFKLDKKMVARIMAGALAALMVLGTMTMTIMYLFEAGHVH